MVIKDLLRTQSATVPEIPHAGCRVYLYSRGYGELDRGGADTRAPAPDKERTLERFGFFVGWEREGEEVFLIQTCCGGGNAEGEDCSFDIRYGRWELGYSVGRSVDIFLEGTMRGVFGAVAISMSLYFMLVL